MRLLLGALSLAKRTFSSGRLLLDANAKKGSSPYSATVLVPRTAFPARLEGAKRLARDREIVASEAFRSLYAWQREARKDSAEWVLHDGPPYANGDPHIGHAVNKVLKDIANRWNLVKGFRVHYQPGWDCHGLPIELKVRSLNDPHTTSKKLTPLQTRTEARVFARATVDSQREEFRSWGVMGDWDEPYLTMGPAYVKNQLRQFHALVETGRVFQRYMPVYWSPASRTALAESELEYNPQHKSTAVYVRFQLTAESAARLVGHEQKAFLLIWTTTPWSLIGNRAICYNEGASYSVIRKDEDVYVVATELLQREDILAMFPNQEVVKTILGKDLEDCFYHHPMSEFLQCQKNSFPVLPGSHVTLDAGTGLVHTAPSHGQDDYLVGVAHDLDLSCQVDELGCFTEDAGAAFAGLPVLAEGSRKVLEILRGGHHLLKMSDFVHSYPYDWRSKTPVILRGSKQWFIDVASLQKRALECLKSVKIRPDSAKTGFQGVLEKRPYWCISRQRVWGAPIPVFYGKESGEVVINEKLVEKYCSLVDNHGTDFWWKLSDREILEDTGLDPESVRKGEDILDVWFDSGISWSCLDKHPSDLYLEGLDQFSGWFYSSLMTSLALKDSAPFKSIFVHGFTMDEKGRKMSKSLGNVVSPKMITEGGGEKKKSLVYGVDCLRMWVAAHASQASSILVGDLILGQTKQELDRLRLIYKFLLGNVTTLESKEQLLPHDQLLPLDRYVLHCLAEHCEEISGFFDEMQFNKVCLSLQKFVATTLSSFYFHRVKDRLYCDGMNSAVRQSAVTTAWHILDGLNYSCSPITPILAAEIKQEKGIVADAFREVFQFRHWVDESLADTFKELSKLHEDVTKQVAADKLKEYEMTISPKSAKSVSILQQVDDRTLAEYFQMPKVTISLVARITGFIEIDTEDFTLAISPSSGHFCPRCRLRTSPRSDALCNRCEFVLTGEGRTLASSI